MTANNGIAINFHGVEKSKCPSILRDDLFTPEKPAPLQIIDGVVK